MKSTKAEPTSHIPKTLLVGVHAPENKIKNIESYFDEFIQLVRSNGLDTNKKIFVKLREISPAYFFGKGKVEEIKKICEEECIEKVVISDPISSQQERNLGDYLNCDICDRTQLILEIFEKNAHSAEGKTQVEIAMLTHRKTRLAGKGIHMSQQTGISGKMGGAGETAKEKEKRYLEEHIITLKKRLESLQKVRETQRKNRFKSNVPHMCLIGYTNSGKSTILNLLTKSNVLAEDRLSATLDTTTREFYMDGKKKGIISDSVGFIQQLPHNLIDAFKSTLDELQYADLLLHVIDVSDPNMEAHIKIVHDILDELGIKKNVLYIFNKADKLENIKPVVKQVTQINTQELAQALDTDAAPIPVQMGKQTQEQPTKTAQEQYVSPTKEQIIETAKKYSPRVLISAKSKDGAKELTNYLESWVK